MTTEPPATAPNPAPALQTPDDVRAAAEQLSSAADAYNRRLKREAATLTSAQVFARLQEEQQLRSLANQLYFEATQRTLALAVDDCAALRATLAAASDRLAGFDRFEEASALMTDLLELAGTILAGSVSPVLAALTKVRRDIAVG